MQIPVACTLSAPDAADRLGEWREVLARAVTGLDRPRPDRLELRLRDDAAQVAAVVDLARREKACCSFFDFTLEIGAAGSTLVVQVPDQASPVLSDFASLAGEH